jgi:LPXTG-motif cell wall-anchored protein
LGERRNACLKFNKPREWREEMDIATITNVAFFVMFLIAGGLGLWMWKKKKDSEG